MSWQTIHHDDVAATEGWCEALLDVREEDGAVHRSVNHEGSDNPVVAQAGDESDCTLESAPTAGDALFSHGGENLLEGQIRLFGNQSQDPVRVLFQWRNTPAARFRSRAPCLTPALAPSNYRTNAHLEDLGYLPPRRSAFNRFNRTLTQVRGIRPRHRFSSPANQFPQIRLDDSGWESLRFNADGKCSRCPMSSMPPHSVANDSTTR